MHPRSEYGPGKLVLSRFVLPVIALACAPADLAFAQHLAAFLELGCDVQCTIAELRDGEHLLDLAHAGTLLLLSPHSWPEKLPRDRWEEALTEAWLLLAPCPYPPVLERQPNFFRDRRAVKRWLWQKQPQGTWSADLEPLYKTLADAPGIATIEDRDLALRFTHEAAGDFDRVVWLRSTNLCQNLTQVTGHLGAELELPLDGRAHENLQRLRSELAQRRHLVLLEGVDDTISEALHHPQQRSSIILLPGAIQTLDTDPLEHADSLMRNRRYAEAHEIYSSLMSTAGAQQAAHCARELSWICEHWGLSAEAERWRTHDHRPAPTRQASLFE